MLQEFISSLFQGTRGGRAQISLYNSLSRSLERFTPIVSGKVSMYHCGPTVYDYPHIGNLRAYVFADLLRRALEWNGYQVTQVVNITDVGHLTSDADSGEDKMTLALKRLGKPLNLQNMREVGTIYFEAFKEDLRALNILTPHHFPRASDYVKEMLALIEKLDKAGLTYKLSDGIYFDTGAFGRYGALPGSAPSLVREVGGNSLKRSPRDFALWKLDPNLGWESPYGLGFPGWHLECSAMSMKILGETFDIHTGGPEHMAIHHNNEIAQSEGATGKPFVRFWLHGAWLNLGGEKMAKSSGGFLRLKDLKKFRVSPMDFRYLLLTALYRTPMEFSEEALRGAKEARKKIIKTLKGLGSGGAPSSKWLSAFKEKVNNDLNIPQALAVFHDMLKSDLPGEDKRATALEMDKVFGLGLSGDLGGEVPEIPEEIKILANKRESLRAKNDWKGADKLREEIERLGFGLKDTKDGPELSELSN